MQADLDCLQLHCSISLQLPLQLPVVSGPRAESLTYSLQPPAEEAEPAAHSTERCRPLLAPSTLAAR